jgi:hypothetical protein
MSNLPPFTPSGTTTKVTVTATSSDETVATGSNQLLLTNLGTNKCFVRWGEGAQTAVVTDLPVLSGASLVISRHPDADTVAAICDATESATLYVTPGRGGG